jgi:hypothetical protein
MPFRPEKLTVKSQEALQRAQQLAEERGINNCCRCICSKRCSMRLKASSGRCSERSASTSGSFRRRSTVN